MPRAENLRASRAARVPSPTEARSLRRTLLAWFDRARRDLPWRRARDPYAIWISEVMLQQTRVEVVREAWPRFMGRFPDLASLARAETDQVLSAWSGLGYYRRARQLHAAARRVEVEHAGRLPDTADELRRLPGFGPYTTGAVLSIAFGQPVVAIDGNVQRVLARSSAELSDPARGAARRRIEQRATALLADDGRSADWTQALMELGALVCTPRTPDCASCPWRASCAAQARGWQARIPARPARRPSVAVRAKMLWITRGDCALLEQRDEHGLMAGMWQLPTTAVDAPAGMFGAELRGLAVVPGRALAQLNHTITRHALEVELCVGAVRGRPPARCRWFRLSDLRRGAPSAPALTGLTRKALGPLLERAELRRPRARPR